jgi:hypothetical protein
MAKSQNQISFETKVTSRISKMESNILKLLTNENAGIFKALTELDKYSKANKPSKDFDEEEFKKNLWKKISEEWGKALSKQLTSVLKTDLTTLLADIKFDNNEFGNI